MLTVAVAVAGGIAVVYLGYLTHVQRRGTLREAREFAPRIEATASDLQSALRDLNAFLEKAISEGARGGAAGSAPSSAIEVRPHGTLVRRNVTRYDLAWYEAGTVMQVAMTRPAHSTLPVIYAWLSAFDDECVVNLRGTPPAIGSTATSSQLRTWQMLACAATAEGDLGLFKEQLVESLWKYARETDDVLTTFRDELDIQLSFIVARKADVHLAPFLPQKVVPLKKDSSPRFLPALPDLVGGRMSLLPALGR